MKAKMPESQKPAEPGTYDCIWCDTIFTYSEQQGPLTCPNCGASNRRDLVPIYMLDNPAEQKMYTSVDFIGG